MKKGTRIFIDIFVMIVLVAIDQLTKQAAAARLMDRPAFDIIPEVLQLYYLPGGNRGAAWGMLSGHLLLFLVISSAVVLLILYMLYRIPAGGKYTILRVLLVFIAAGGLGNMIDRAARAYVIDFIYISCINFPVFNVADMYVSVCTIMLAIIVLFKYKEEDYGVFDDAFAAPFREKTSKKKDQ